MPVFTELVDYNGTCCELLLSTATSSYHQTPLVAPGTKLGGSTSRVHRWTEVRLGLIIF